jgi:hypothetical protein
LVGRPQLHKESKQGALVGGELNFSAFNLVIKALNLGNKLFGFYALFFNSKEFLVGSIEGVFCSGGIELL